MNLEFKSFDENTTPTELYELRGVMTTVAAGIVDSGTDGYLYITAGPNLKEPPTQWDGPFIKATPECLATNELNTAVIIQRVEQIRSVALNDETAHRMEDELHRDVLRAIAESRCSDPVKCARLALTTQDIEFARWYSGWR